MHQFNPLSMIANEGDSREREDRPHYYGDDHLWIVLATCWYLKETGDLEFLDKSIPFYEKVFGWAIHEMPGDWRYVTNGSEETATAGLCDARGVVADGTPSYWRVYLMTSDVDGDLVRIGELGGSVLDGPVDSPYGRVATVSDPQGASFQLLQPPSA